MMSNELDHAAIVTFRLTSTKITPFVIKQPFPTALQRIHLWDWIRPCPCWPLKY